MLIDNVEAPCQAKANMVELQQLVWNQAYEIRHVYQAEFLFATLLTTAALHLSRQGQLG